MQEINSTHIHKAIKNNLVKSTENKEENSQLPTTTLSIAHDFLRMMIPCQQRD